MFWKTDKEKIKNDEINGIVTSLTNGDYDDTDISEIVNSINERVLGYLKHRREHLSNELEECITSIKKLEP